MSIFHRFKTYLNGSNWFQCLRRPSVNWNVSSSRTASFLLPPAQIVTSRKRPEIKCPKILAVPFPVQSFVEPHYFGAKIDIKLIFYKLFHETYQTCWNLTFYVEAASTDWACVCLKNAEWWEQVGTGAGELCPYYLKLIRYGFTSYLVRWNNLTSTIV